MRRVLTALLVAGACFASAAPGCAGSRGLPGRRVERPSTFSLEPVRFTPVLNRMVPAPVRQLLAEAVRRTLVKAASQRKIQISARGLVQTAWTLRAVIVHLDPGVARGGRAPAKVAMRLQIVDSSTGQSQDSTQIAVVMAPTARRRTPAAKLVAASVEMGELGARYLNLFVRGPEPF